MNTKIPKESDKSSKTNSPECGQILKLIVYGHRYEANRQLMQNPALLLEESDVMDYSGRLFKNITAYEYAYWAKDRHACRLLEAHMDKAIKAAILARCEAMESVGISYEQYGHIIKNSKHFDFNPLIAALKYYVENYELWRDRSNWEAMGEALLTIGWEQRNVPVHVANEYCRLDRSFEPNPDFNEDSLPENLSVFNYKTESEEAWFPLKTADANDLGVNFSIIFTEIGSRRCYMVRSMEKKDKRWDWVGRRLAERKTAGGKIDLAAISRLDTVRTADLIQSLENLKTG